MQGFDTLLAKLRVPLKPYQEMAVKAIMQEEAGEGSVRHHFVEFPLPVQPKHDLEARGLELAERSMARRGRQAYERGLRCRWQERCSNAQMSVLRYQGACIVLTGGIVCLLPDWN